MRQEGQAPSRRTALPQATECRVTAAAGLDTGAGLILHLKTATVAPLGAKRLLVRGRRLPKDAPVETTMPDGNTVVPDRATATPLDHLIIAATSLLPNNWLGLRLAILLRRAVTMRLAGDAGIDVERWGLRMRLHPRHSGCEKGLLFTPQMYEVDERAELAAEIARAAAAERTFVFIDIGANVGLFSLYVASRTGEKAKILAFEPEPENVRRLRFNVDANPGIPIQVFDFALGDTEGGALLVPNERDRGGSRALRLSVEAEAANAIRVRCRPLLDVLIQEGLQSVDALKIDVEGMEDTILIPFFRNAPTSLWPRLLIIEDTSGLWQLDLFSELKALGYVVSTRTKLNVMMRR
jgi:FkbM family methyltransferase